MNTHNFGKLSFPVIQAEFVGKLRTCQKGDEWFPSQETTDSSDLLALAEWISIWRCTLVYTLLQSPPASAIIVSVMFGVLLDTV